MTEIQTTSWLGSAPFSDEQDKMAQILDEYLSCLERGESIEPADLLARHPQCAAQLQEYLSGLALIRKAAAFAVPLLPQEASLLPAVPRELGDFRLIREIGRGGMGVVYEAIQFSLGRRVAVKMLPLASSVNPKQILRFKNEAQAAAQIDHPNIVPVFAIGQEQGIHYFAMQLIGGQSLSQLLAELRDEAGDGLPAAHAAHGPARSSESPEHVQAVARIGAQVADALHAAHEIGVVHRDVKPSNLLLDERGKVWITDFGVARCRSNTNLTETGHLVGTLPYMSPEQALGHTALIDHRTDVYSLGVTLFELATLRHPGEGVADAATVSEFRRADWRPPRYWNPSIPVDFENIVLKSMAERRDERYATARELAEDLNRFLDGHPILARRPSLASRAGRWAKRHKRSVAAAAAALALAMSGLVVSLVVISSERAAKETAYQIATANQARAEKNYEAAQAKFKLAREMLDRFGARVNEWLANDMPGAEGVRQELLAEMLPYYRQFASESSDDPSLQADLALTFSKIGYLSDQLGSRADAEQAYRDALEILLQLARRQPPKPDHLRSLAMCHSNLGQLLEKRGDVGAAREQFGRALAIQQELVDAAPASIEHRTDLAATHSSLGLVAGQAGDRQKAVERFRTAIEIQESIRRETPRDETNLNNLAASYNNLSALFMHNEPRMAQRWVEKALLIQLDLVRHFPKQPAHQNDLALSYSNLGTIHSRLSNWADAELCFRDAITIQQRLITIAPLVATYRRDLAVSYNNLGMSQSSAGSLGDAEQSFTQALALQQELVEAHPQDVNLLSGLGGVYNNLGMVHQKLQRLTDAAAAFERAIVVQERAHDRAPGAAQYRESLSKHYYNYARVLGALDRPADAAAVALARRDLWPGDSSRLSRIAEELAAHCKQMPPGPLRQRYVNETRRTLQAAVEAGLDAPPNFTASPFDVLVDSSKPTVVTAHPPMPDAGSGTGSPMNLQ